MAHAHIMDDLPTGGSRPNKRGNLTMLQIDDVCGDLLHLGVMPIEDSAALPGLPGLGDDAYDHAIE